MTTQQLVQDTLKEFYPNSKSSSSPSRTRLTQATLKKFSDFDFDTLKKQKKGVWLSYGGGQDSSALAYKLMFDRKFRQELAPDYVHFVMADTGNEHPETYDYLRYFAKLCERHEIEFYFLTPDMGFHTKAWRSLTDFYQRTRTCGSKAFRRSCTDNLKIKVIYRFLEWWINHLLGYPYTLKKGYYKYKRRYGKLKILVGFTYGEEKRIRKRDPIQWRADTVELLYPLIDLRMCRGKCQQLISEYGIEVPLPSNCMFCPFISKLELLWLYLTHEQAFWQWVAIEHAKLEHFKDREAQGKKNYGVFPKGNGHQNPTLKDILAEAQAEYKGWTYEQIHEYKMSHGHLVASTF